MSKKNSVLKFGIFSAFLGGAYALTNYIYKLTSVPVQHTDESPDYDKAITAGRMFVRNHKDKQDMYINSIDQLKLHAAYIPASSNSHRYVILVHGIKDNHEYNGIYAQYYLSLDVNCLLPDLRGFGKSEGKYVGYGLDDSSAYTNLIRRLNNKKRSGGFYSSSRNVNGRRNCTYDNR